MNLVAASPKRIFNALPPLTTPSGSMLVTMAWPSFVRVDILPLHRSAGALLIASSRCRMLSGLFAITQARFYRRELVFEMYLAQGLFRSLPRPVPFPWWSSASYRGANGWAGNCPRSSTVPRTCMSFARAQDGAGPLRGSHPHLGRIGGVFQEATTGSPYRGPSPQPHGNRIGRLTLERPYRNAVDATGHAHETPLVRLLDDLGVGHAELGCLRRGDEPMIIDRVVYVLYLCHAKSIAI